jgi:hypothetical protein
LRFLFWESKERDWVMSCWFWFKEIKIKWKLMYLGTVVYVVYVGVYTIWCHNNISVNKMRYMFISCLDYDFMITWWYIWL